MPRVLIDCREAQRLLSLRRDTTLRPVERCVLWLHLKACDWCSIVERNLAFLARALRRLDP